MKVLVTGPTGPSGQYILERLLTTDASVRVLALPETLHRIPYRTEIEIVPGSLEDDSSIAEAVDGVSYVYHTANVMPPPRRTPAEMQHINRDGTRKLLDACCDTTKRFIFVSTVTVFTPHPTPDTWPVKEGAPRLAHGNPQLEAYGQSMIDAENEVFEAHARHGLEYCILRPTVICGRNARFADQMISGLLKDPYQAQGFDAQFGTMQWVHGIDVARAALLASEHPAAANEVFIVAGSKSITTYDALVQLWTIINPTEDDNPFVEIAQENRAALNKFSYRKIQEALGYEPTISVRQCIEEILGRIEFYTSSGIRLPQRPRVSAYEV